MLLYKAKAEISVCNCKCNCNNYLIESPLSFSVEPCVNFNAKQKHLGLKKGEANQKQQLSDYTCD